ncbi:hypothetical protein DB346_22680 [Verrucomicrobia bacterium LW23]|nr:hypothetical protein DB346_22680 [Verrucomicrobia bacterium LW23]
MSSSTGPFITSETLNSQKATSNSQCTTTDISKGERLSHGLSINNAIPIIAFSHIKWNSVWRRPQEILSRLSSKHAVLYIEEPEGCKEIHNPEPAMRYDRLFPNVLILCPRLPGSLMETRNSQDEGVKAVVDQVLTLPLGQTFQSPLLWFCNPMPAPLFIHALGERIVVYDCIEEFSHSNGTPAELAEREDMLLAEADIIFTKGNEMYNMKSRESDNVYYYREGADSLHFSKALNNETEVPDFLIRLEGPILGYFGTIDDRLDFGLIEFVSKERPDWNLVMIGPPKKVQESSLPHSANIFWFGFKKYVDLPGIAKSFDVCIMPFAINDATRNASPTKALEYMATGTPVVSTAIKEVEEQYFDIIKIGRSYQGFLDLCDSAIHRPDIAAIERGRRMARQNGWESLLERLQHHMNAALAKADHIKAATK